MTREPMTFSLSYKTQWSRQVSLSHTTQDSPLVWFFCATATMLSLLQHHTYLTIFVMNGEHQDRFFHKWLYHNKWNFNLDRMIRERSRLMTFSLSYRVKRSSQVNLQVIYSPRLSSRLAFLLFWLLCWAPCIFAYLHCWKAVFVSCRKSFPWAFSILYN